MTNLDLLILEDSDADFKKIHQTNISVFNKKEKSVNFNEHRARNIDDAKNILQAKLNFVGAIIDLKIDNEVADEGRGNELIAEIFNKYRIPIFIYSNNLALLDDIYSTSDNKFLRSYKKEIPFMDILEEVKGLYSTGIIDILGKRGLIDSFLNKIFWDHFSKNIDQWGRAVEEKEENEKILLRFISEHLREHLEISEGKLPFAKYLPNELYIFPAIKEFVFTGTILFNGDGGKTYLVLNPSCDFANDKVDHILVTEIKSNSSILNRAINRYKETIDLDEIDLEKITAQKMLISLINNSNSPRYYYLPRGNSFQGGLIDFQKLETIRKKTIGKSNKIIGSVTGSFMKDITAKFSYYYSRQGSPDFDWDNIVKDLIV